MSIVPDTKDWTWVLERPCPECGLDTASLTTAAIGPAMEAMGQQWAELLDKGDPVRLCTRPTDSVWSMLEYGCHVRDVFRKARERTSMMLQESHPTFANWDQDETASADDYSTQDPATVAAQVAEEARVVASLFASIRPADWDRSGRRSDGAHFTVASFGRYVVHDPFHHLHDVGLAFNL